MEFRILGPVQVRDGDRAVPVGGGRATAVLTCLLLHANTTVPRSRLVELCWAKVPDSAESNLRTYLSRLRKALTPAGESGSRLVSDAAGHRLVVREGELDLAEFDGHIRRADAAGDPAAAATGYEAAVALWRGELFDGATVESFLASARAELVERRDHVRIKALRARLGTGAHAETLASLRALVTADPTHQELVGLLMLALHRSGRQDEALALYRDTRRRLDEELGVEPGAALSALHSRLLNGADEPVAAEPRSGGAAPVVPAQLPANVPGFTGRHAAIEAVTALTKRRHADPAAAAAAVVDGMGGIGKTALAVHVGHRVARDYPDGQLFMDLHGYTAGVAPVDPADALQRMLRALGVPPDDVPADPDDRAALYRTTLRSRKVLVLLDNCADSAQLSPLLPGEGQSFVIATSRRRLVELDAAATVSLNVMDSEESAQLFRAAAGDALTGEAGSGELVTDVARRCGNLPLAIRLAAGRLRSRRGWSLRRLRDRLSEEGRILAELSLGERNVAAALALSYNDLTTAAARGFEQLAAHPSAEFDGYAAAALADVPLPEAEELLERLGDANLLIEAGTAGRYRMHDLVRAFAAQRGREHGTAADRESGLERLLELYRDLAWRARAQLAPRRPAVPPPLPSRPAPEVDDPDSARRFFEVEYQSLLDSIQAALSRGLDRQAVDLTLACWTYADRYDRYLEQIRAIELAIPAARRLADDAVTAALRMRLGTAKQCIGRSRDGLSDLEEAAELYRRCGDRVGEAETLSTVVMAQHYLGRYAETVAAARRSIALSEAVGDGFSKCVAIVNVSTSLRCLGLHDEGASLLDEALELAREAGNGVVRAFLLINLGHLRHDRGEYGAALACHLEAAAYFAERAEPSGHAEALFGQMAALRCSGATGEALSLSHRVAALIGSADDLELIAGALLEIGLAQLAAGNRRAALDHLEQARSTARKLAPQLVHCRIEAALAAAAAATGDVEQARVHRGQVADLAKRLGIVEVAVRAAEPPLGAS